MGRISDEEYTYYMNIVSKAQVIGACEEIESFDYNKVYYLNISEEEALVFIPDEVELINTPDKYIINGEGYRLFSSLRLPRNGKHKTTVVGGRRLKALNFLFHNEENISNYEIDITKLDTSQVVEAFCAFCKFKGIMIGFETLNFENLTYARHMFEGARIDDFDFTKYQFKKLQDASNMFIAAQSVNVLDLSSIKELKYLQVADYMFSEFVGPEINISNIDLRHVYHVDDMLNCTSGVTILDISNIKIGNMDTFKKAFITYQYRISDNRIKRVRPSDKYKAYEFVKRTMNYCCIICDENNSKLVSFIDEYKEKVDESIDYINSLKQ